MNPTFHCQSTIFHHLLLQSGLFLNKCCFYINKYHCNKNGVKRPSSWSDTPFWPISLGEDQQKRCQKGGKPTFTKSAFQNPGWFCIIKEVLLSCFGMKRGPAWGVVVCYVKTQCQNLIWISVQTTRVVLLAPNFMNHLVISFKHDLYQKSHISGHLLCWPPLRVPYKCAGKDHCFFFCNDRSAEPWRCRTINKVPLLLCWSCTG